jgi:cysteinyl-tRNA synthetase
MRADDIPHATEYIERMLELVEELLAKGHAYVIDGSGVYFDVVSYPDYGALPHRTLEQLLESAGARVDVDEEKRSPVDFALWKAAKPGEPSWDSPWGPGRPGWHIECSAMSLDLLGAGFDLHGAGDDLVFPHNENERAQAEAAGHAFATHWMHSGMVEIGGEKMSKSLGNFRTLEEALDAHGGRAFRLAVLQTHYRKAMELGDAELTDAAKAVGRLDALARRAAAAGVEASEADLDEQVVARFRAEMDDDFGTPGAVAAIFEAATAANLAIDDGDHATAGRLLGTVLALAAVLGLEVARPSRGDDEIDALVAQRDAARQSKDFAEADRLRDELASRGITLEDTASGTIWHR